VADRFSTYKEGVWRLVQFLDGDDPRYVAVLTYCSRLAGNIHLTRLFGDTETRRSERVEIIDRLNALTEEALGVSFDALCQLKQATGGTSTPQEGEKSGSHTLDDLSLGDLRRERIRLGLTEKKLVQEASQIQTEKRAVFGQATKESSVRKQRIMARKIKELDTKARNVDRSLRVVSQQLRIINGFIQVKENKRIWEQSGLWSQISQMDLTDLEAYGTDAMIEGSFNADRFGNIIRTLEGTEGFVEEMAEDPDVNAILTEIQAAVGDRGEDRTVEADFARLQARLARAGDRARESIESEDREVGCRDTGEAFAVAQLEGLDTGTPMVANDEYALLAGVLSRIPEGFVGEPIELPGLEEVEIDVVIFASGMDVLPGWKQTLRLRRGQESSLVEFRLIPRDLGRNQIVVEFYHRRHWLAQVEFDLEVVEGKPGFPA